MSNFLNALKSIEITEKNNRSANIAESNIAYAKLISDALDSMRGVRLDPHTAGLIIKALDQDRLAKAEELGFGIALIPALVEPGARRDGQPGRADGLEVVGDGFSVGSVLRRLGKIHHLLSCKTPSIAGQSREQVREAYAPPVETIADTAVIALPPRKRGGITKAERLLREAQAKQGGEA